MKNQRFLLIQIQFGRLILSKTFFECVRVFVCLCAHSSCGCSFFYRNQKTIIHYYAYGSMRKTLHGKATETIGQQSKWIFICSFSNFIPLARTKWKLIVQKLIKNFRGTENCYFANAFTLLIAATVSSPMRSKLWFLVLFAIESGFRKPL